MTKNIADQILNLLKKWDHPFYIYDIDQLNAKLLNFKLASFSNLKLWYACKANPLKEILKSLLDNKISFDVASIGELNQVLSLALKKDFKILTTGPSKLKSYLKILLEKNVDVFVLESINQVKWLNELAAEYKIKPKSLLRLQLNWDNSDTSVLGGNEITPFGLDFNNWLELEHKDFAHLDLIGVHIFQWGNILNQDMLFSIWDRCLSEAFKLASELKFELKVLDVGGGLGIPYSNDQLALNEEIIFKHLNQLGINHRLEIWMELGRFLVGDIGSYYNKVTDRKMVRGKNLLVLDGGINHLARPALTHQGFPCELFLQNDHSSQKTKSFQIHGPLCTSLDQLGTYNLNESVNVGDWLVFKQCGAYGFTESMPYFLGHSLAGEAVIEAGNLRVTRAPTPASLYLNLK